MHSVPVLVREAMNSNIEWEKWGERDPLYAVSSWKGKERGSPGAWTDDEFYELGRSDWQDFMRHWKAYGLRFGSVLEIGCGAGRITNQLASCFGSVTAVDVSQHQLDYARSRISASNVSFVKTDGNLLPGKDAGFDAIFSCHVFQHFESHKAAYSVFREAYRVLGAEGTFMIHLPLYDLPSSRAAGFLASVIALENRIIGMKARIDRRRLRKGQWKPLMRFLFFDRRQLVRELQQIGFSDIELSSFPMRSNQHFHEFIFATKHVANNGDSTGPSKVARF